ncbi:MAG: hypothetical protein AAF217_05675 [Pseudomonadota bacterium]
MTRIFLSFFLMLWFTALGYAFGTINFLGQNSEHEKITRIALKELGFSPETLTLIAGKGPTIGAVAFIDLPGSSLIPIPAAHCDNGDYLDIPGYPGDRKRAQKALNDCRKFIFSQFKSAVSSAAAFIDSKGQIDPASVPTEVKCSFSALENRAKCKVLTAIGLVFHASQDFYSHTNWTDVPANRAIDASNPPGLGNNAPAPFIDPSKNSAFPDGLISGCFFGVPEELYCAALNGQQRVRHLDLSKDFGSINVQTEVIGIGTSNRGKVNWNFQRAVLAAIEDTRSKWNYYETTILENYGKEHGSKIICTLKKDDPLKECQ